MLALGVALVAAGGLGGTVLYMTTGHRVAVLALTTDVPAGQQITAADLTEVQITLDPAVKPLSADSHVLEMRATTDLKAGQLLTASDLTNDALVGPGYQVVGVAAKPEQLPAGGVQQGAWVVLVYTPSGVGNGGADPAGTLPTAVTGAPAPLQPLTVRVVDVGAPLQSGGTVVVDVAVPPDKAAAVANLVASGKFLLLLAAPGTKGGG